VITRNEAHRVARCLQSVGFADEIVVVDSESTDGTMDVCRAFTDKVFVRPFDSFVAQKNAALEYATGEWVVPIDADEVVSPELAREIRETIDRDPPEAGFLVYRENYFCGRPIRHVWHNDRQVRLLRRGRVRYVRPVHEDVLVDGTLGVLRHRLQHFNSTSVGEYVAKHERYATLEARMKYERGERFDPVKLLLSPLRVLWLRYVRIGGYRDGWMGLLLSLLFAWFVFRVHVKILALQRGQAGSR
jgi:glycosyltransferase involved in cell wall biosynthesis